MSVFTFLQLSAIADSSLLMGKKASGQQAEVAHPVDTLEPSLSLNFEPSDDAIVVDTINENDGTLSPTLSITGEIPSNDEDADDEFTQDDRTRYIVREGDTLADIADIFNISVATIKNTNPKATSKKLTPGVELIISPIDGVPYQVKKGDTLSTIAKAFGVDSQDIADFNYLLDATVIAGKTIFIPNGKPLPVPTSTTANTRVSTNTPSTSAVSYSGTLGRPVNGVITSGYKPSHRPNHKGVDYGAQTGTPIYAAASGYVQKATPGWNGGYGNVVVIGHGEIDTLYAHMSRIETTTGSYVEKGQVIGYVGSTGRSTGPHLHFEVRQNGRPINPMPYLR